MRISCLFVAIVIAGSLTAGCSQNYTDPTAPSPGGSPSSLNLSGTWSLASLQPAGEAASAAPSGATYQITFTDGRLSTRADCNVCGGAFALSGQDLIIGPALACTRAACPTMAFENAYTRVLSGNNTVTLSGNTLVLSSTRGVLHFTR